MVTALTIEEFSWITMKLEIQTKFFHFARGIKMPIEKVYLNPWNVLELAINI
jgi:hypothetical protein